MSTVELSWENSWVTHNRHVQALGLLCPVLNVLQNDLIWPVQLVEAV